MKDITQIIARFREAGLKVTPQRTSICRLLEENRSHPSAEDVYRQALSIHPSISFTTVYKTLQTLRDLGEIRQLCIDPERVRFDTVSQEHAHFFCKSCRSITDLGIEDEGQSILEGFLPDDWEREVHQVQINMIGLCGGCRNTDPAH